MFVAITSFNQIILSLVVAIPHQLNIVVYGYLTINNFKPPIYIYLKTGYMNTSNCNRFKIIYHFYIVKKWKFLLLILYLYVYIVHGRRFYPIIFI